MIDTDSNISLVINARRDLLTVARTTDPHLTPEGLLARQRREVEAIRARLIAAMPAEPAEAPDREPVFDALAPTDADSIARVQHEQGKVAAILASGRVIEQVIADASRERLAAILDGLETSDEVLRSFNPEAKVEYLRGVIWDRLAQVDDTARAIVAAEEGTIPARAWRSILEGVATTGTIPFEGRVLLNETDAAALGLLDEGDAVAVPGPSGNSIELLVDALDRTPVDA